MAQLDKALSEVLRGSLGASPFPRDGAIEGYGSLSGILFTVLAFSAVGVVSVSIDRTLIGGHSSVSIILIWAAIYNALSTVAAKYVSARMHISLSNVKEKFFPTGENENLIEDISLYYNNTYINYRALVISLSVSLILFIYSHQDLINLSSHEKFPHLLLLTSLLIAAIFLPIFFIGVRVVHSSTIYYLLFKKSAERLLSDIDSSLLSEVESVKKSKFLVTEFDQVSRNILIFWLLVSVAVSSLLLIFDDLPRVSWLITIYSAVVSIGIASVVFIFTSIHVNRTKNAAWSRFTDSVYRRLEDASIGEVCNETECNNSISQIISLENHLRLDGRINSSFNAIVSVLSPLLPIISAYSGLSI